MQAYLIADSFVSLAAVGGLWILFSTLKHGETSDSLQIRFQFGILAVSVMMLARVLWWATGYGLFDTITIIAAALVPLAALILCEGLLQRHAPRPMKFLTAGGAVLFCILAFLPPGWVDPQRLFLLLGFQCVVFAGIGYLVLFRDKESLSVADNSTVERIGLSLLLILPFAITDFRTELYDTPVRMSGIAILFLCWLAISLGRGNLAHWEIVRSFSMVIVSAIAAGLSIAWLADLDVRTTTQVVAMIVSATVLASIYNESKTNRRDHERDSLLRYIAENDTPRQDVFLRGLQNHALVEGALILKSTDLGDFDHKLRDCFDGDPIRKRSDLGTTKGKKHEEQLDWLFEKFGATHVMLVNRDPLTLVALNMPTLAAASGAETELRAVQRVAALLLPEGKA